MSEASRFPRDDRSWPRGAFAVSLLCGVAALTASAALVADAGSVGRAADLVLVFVVLAVAQGVVWVAGLNAWLRSRSVPRRSRGMQAALVALVLFAFTGGLSTGAAALCGCLAGIFLPTASSVRYARVNLALADRGRPELGEERDEEGPREPVVARTPDRPATGRRTVLTGDRDVTLAWAAATTVVALVLVAAGASFPTVAAVVLVGVVALTGVFQRLDRVWPALQHVLDGSEERVGAEVARVSGVVSEETPATVGWFTLFAWRCAGLLLLGVLVAWWD